MERDRRRMALRKKYRSLLGKGLVFLIFLGLAVLAFALLNSTR